MRITNGMMQRQALTGLQRNLTGLNRIQQQLSSGKRVSKGSDDPVGVTTILQSNSQLRALTQYQRNLDAARARQGVEEQTLQELTQVLERARELGVSQGTGTADTQTRLTTQAEVDRLLDFVVGLGNTQFQGRYIFGGDYADQQPFTGTATNPAAPPQGEIQVEVGPGQRVGMNHSGQEVFVDTGVFTALEDLSAALGADDPDAIRGALTDLDDAFNGVQEIIGDLGARQSTLDIASNNLQALEINLETFRSSVEDTDMEAAVTELVNRQTTFQAAMLANARIMDQSLTDYLR